MSHGVVCDHARGSLERCNASAQFAIIYKRFSYYYCAQHAVEIETSLAARDETDWKKTPIGRGYPTKAVRQ